MRESHKQKATDLPALANRSGVFELIGQATREDVEQAAHMLASPDQSDTLRRQIASTNAPVALALLTEAHNPGAEFASTEEAILYGMRIVIAMLDRADLRAEIGASNNLAM
ncbi:MAG: hypothetical protein JWO35_720 [Candidatus Saccharibacteria bacterium]|nr:hypothetical protein [Candidatus Saccharibacteria bacterium]